MIEGAMDTADHLNSDVGSEEQNRVKKMKAFFDRLQDGVRTTAKVTQQIAAGESWPLPVLNGVIGDTLADKNSSLAIEMKLIGAGQSSKICIFVHGICDSEKAWSAGNMDSYSARLQQDFGFDPLYLRYNSGRHISTNGQQLAQLLDEFFKNSETPIEDIIFVAHSLGGLVTRSACYYGEKAEAEWVSKVSKIFFLGTPHEGNEFEKLGNLTTNILRIIPNPWTKGISFIGNMRSAAIKDLRYGYLRDEDWKLRDPNALWGNNRHPVSLLADTKHYIILGTLTEDVTNRFKQYFGDGVVMMKSAKGLSQEEDFPADHLRIIHGMSHIGLLQDSRVYEQLYRWISIS